MCIVCCTFLSIQENEARREAEARRLRREKLMAEDKAKRAAKKKESENKKIRTEVVDRMLAAMKGGSVGRRTSSTSTAREALGVWAKSARRQLVKKPSGGEWLASRQDHFHARCLAAAQTWKKRLDPGLNGACS